MIADMMMMIGMMADRWQMKVLAESLTKFYLHPLLVKTILLLCLYHCTVADGATVAPGEEVHKNSSRVGFFRLLLLEISTADIFEAYTEKMNFPGGLVSENLQFY